MKLTAAAEANMQYKNDNMTDKTHMWQFQESKKHGFMECFYKLKENEKILSDKELIYMVATTKSMTLHGTKCQAAMDDLALRAIDSSCSSM